MNFKESFVLLLCTYSLVHGSSNSSFISNFYLEEVRSLSELPLDKLIKIKSSFAKKNVDDEYQVAESRSPQIASAVALPLVMPPSPVRRIMSGRGQPPNQPIRRYEEWEEKGKGDSKISKIFQLTLSALSFLAFGGYLLTLIITAIRRNANMTQPNNVIVLSSLTKFKRPKRGLYVYDPQDNDYDTEKLYRGMIMLSSDFSRLQYGQ